MPPRSGQRSNGVFLDFDTSVAASTVVGEIRREDGDVGRRSFVEPCHPAD